MNVYERQARALESIARELKGIGKTLERIKEIFSPEVLLIDESLQKHMTVKKESPGTCYMTEEPCDKCETWNGDGCEYLVRPGEPWPDGSGFKIEHVVIDEAHQEEPKIRAVCRATGLPCIGCVPGACDHRRTEDGGNG